MVQFQSLQGFPISQETLRFVNIFLVLQIDHSYLFLWLLKNLTSIHNLSPRDY